MGEIQELKLILREETSPFFTDEEMAYYLQKNNYNVNAAATLAAFLFSEYSIK